MLEKKKKEIEKLKFGEKCLYRRSDFLYEIIKHENVYEVINTQNTMTEKGRRGPDKSIGHFTLEELENYFKD